MKFYIAIIIFQQKWTKNISFYAKVQSPMSNKAEAYAIVRPSA